MNSQEILKRVFSNIKSLQLFSTAISSSLILDFLKLDKVVIYNSQTKGYRLAKDLDKLSREQVIIEMLEAKHSRADIISRIEVFQEQLKIYDEYLKNGEIILMRKTNEELYDRGSNRTIN